MYNKFAELLYSQGVSAYKVSKETGISQATLSQWKNGLYEIKADKLQKIADYFDVPISYFYGDNAEDVVLSSGEKKLLSIYNELSKEGQDLLLERADELIRLGYIKSNKAGMVGA